MWDMALVKYRRIPWAQTVLPVEPRLLKPHRRLISGVSRRKSKEIMDEIVIR